jgi:phenylalanyl-tRNA synthetase beta chain
MATLGGGACVPGVVDAHPTKPQQPVLPLRLSRISAILGVAVPRAETIRILTALGFAVADGEDETLRCTVPTYRPDVEREIDLIEEVARIYGYDNIPEPAHTPLPSFSPRPRPDDRIRSTTQGLLGGWGYRELYTNSLLSREEAERYNHPVLNSPALGGPVVETLNAISQSMTTLRPSLLPGALQAMGFNQNHGQDVLRFYEFGHVFHRSDRADVPVPGYAEHEAFLMACSGPDAPTGWDRKTRLVDFFDLKGDVEELLDALRLPYVVLTPSYEATPITAYHLAITSGDTPLGLIARLADPLAEAFDLKAPVYFAELDYAALVTLAAPHLARTYQAVSRYPVVDRDIAVVVERGQAVGPMIETIRQAGRPLLRDVGVFDLYEGEGIGVHKKSVAFSLRFGADRTLKDADVDQRVQAIVTQLGATYQAVLRQ